MTRPDVSQDPKKQKKPVDENIAPVGHRQGPFGLGKRNFYYRFFITYRMAEPVMYEYNGKGETDFAYNLTFPHPKEKRNYYKVGDLMFPKDMKMNDLGKRFQKTFGKKEEDKSVFENLADSELLGSSPDIKVALEIYSIDPVKSMTTPGYGVVTFIPVIFFSDKFIAIKDEPFPRFTIEDLNNEIALYPHQIAMYEILPYLRFVQDVIIWVVSGSVKSAISKAGAAYIIEQGVLKPLTAIAAKQLFKNMLIASLKNIGSAILAGSLAFVLEFTKALGEDKKEETMRSIAEKKQYDYKAVDNAIKAGIKGFVATFIENLLGKLIKKTAKDMGYLKEGEEKLSIKLIEAFTALKSEIIQNIIQAYINANNDVKRGKSSTPQLNESLKSEFKKWFGEKTPVIIGKRGSF